MRNVLLLLVFFGCKEPPAVVIADAQLRPPADASPPTEPPKPRPPAPVRRFVAPNLMGGPWTLLIASDRAPAEVSAAADAAFQEVERLEQLFSEWRPDSSISAVNHAAGKVPVQVGPEVFEIIAKSVRFAQLTEGAFDPTWAALRGQWDFKSTPPKLPKKSALQAALKRTGYADIELDPAARTVFLKRPGMALGLGGIGQGYAVDRVTALLRTRGFDRFVVEGTGDLYVAGEKRPGEPWIIGVQHPRDPKKLIAELPVRDAAIVTSGDYERFFELGGKRYHHIIDLKTGMPADRSVATTILAPDATTADALATGFFVKGPEALEIARKMEGVEAAVFTPDGRIHHTEGLKALGESWR